MHHTGAMDPIYTQLAIAGGGLSGMTAALYAARAGLRPLVLTSGTPGGQLCRSDNVEDFPGFVDGIVGRRLGELVMRQAMRFGAEVRFTRITEIDVGERPFTLTAGYKAIQCDALIVALGASPRWLGVPNERRLHGRGVYHHALGHACRHADNPVVVVGGGDSAAEQALYASRFASEVTVIHRRDRLSAAVVLERRLADSPRIEILWDCELARVDGDDAVESVTIRDPGGERVLPASAVIIAVGQDPASELLRGQLAIDSDGYVVVSPGTTRTSVDGVFACGEIIDPRYRQAVTAAGTGCMASFDAHRFLTRPATQSDDLAPVERMVVTGELERVDPAIAAALGALTARDRPLGERRGPPRDPDLTRHPEDLAVQLLHEATSDH